MKIATFNVNNINRRLPNLLQWLKSARPDIACLQELKSTDANFPIHAIEKAGYRAVWQGEKTWNGVAILSRDGEPIVTRRVLPACLLVASIFQTANPCVALALMMVAWAHHILGISDAILSGRRFNHLSVYRRWPVTSHFEK